ncbi:MAG: hypothetical protein QOH52_3677 [Pseudonocardiales bacterium]|jgi:hypothetical protein|nr:hypothetical protein [Pseudonocardiales bacterium]
MSRTVAGGPRTRVAAHGLHVDLPQRWEARLYLRDQPVESAGSDEPAVRFLGARVTHPAAYGHPGASTNPVLHLANFALPPGRGDFGTGAVELMRDEHAFVSLLEYDREEVDRPLFAARGLPRPSARDFAPNALQRRLAGQLGCQRFFTENGRAFCLYVVLGSRRHAPVLVDEVHDVIDNLKVGAR